MFILIAFNDIHSDEQSFNSPRRWRTSGRQLH